VKDESGSSDVSGSSPSKEQPNQQSIGLLFNLKIRYIPEIDNHAYNTYLHLNFEASLNFPLVCVALSVCYLFQIAFFRASS
jgi:hypothetical protein